MRPEIDGSGVLDDAGEAEEDSCGTEEDEERAWWDRYGDDYDYEDR